MKQYTLLITLFFLVGNLIFGQTQTDGNPFTGDALLEESGSPIKRIDVDSIKAMEQFSWGVRAFHEGLYNKALLDFENAVRLKPQEPLYRLWLGNANFATGLGDLAIRQWQSVVNDDKIGGGWLRSRIDTLLFRTSPYMDNTDQDIWTVRHEIVGRNERTVRFQGPTDVSNDPLGTLSYVAGYLSNNIAVFDVNGNLRTRFTGGIMQLDGPWGVLAMNDGNLFVTEFRGRRVTLLNPNGRRLLTFGQNAEDGNLQGPQYMAATEDGYLYVSDWIGGKVVKYDFNGKYIMTLGTASSTFEGLKQPSGIAVTPMEVFVVDTKDRLIHIFDHSGNYLRSIGRGQLQQPENIAIMSNNRLLIADGRRVLQYNLENKSFIETTTLNESAQRIVSLDIDRNGTIVVADQAQDNITYLIPRSELYGGFFLNIHQVISQNFPQMQVIASVQSRSGKPVLGLSDANFLAQENGIAHAPLVVQTLDRRRDGSLTSVILVESSDHMQSNKALIDTAIHSLVQNFNNDDHFDIVWASEQPIHNRLNNTQEIALQLENIFPNFLKNNWRFDRGLRLAGSHLINKNARLAVFFITSGKDPSNIHQFSAPDLASYLQNNNIAFYPIYLEQSGYNRIYESIAAETGGQSFYLMRPRGVAEIIDIARSRASGLYAINYTSTTPSNHGKDYVQLSLMAAIQSQSGLTQSGYFPPITVMR
ncbi:6-bladed beta-propeller [Entomospira nematocerorum]|uniref:6-bladed beta-propeller n=1 Tax=Entomospira nematocerorum TaxID=2719987 RepID=A0A968KXK0_9SPIO|nr:6-bladed beta-propeller [Entomospira nematocera]NIZ46637.1 hypothetical protein [Entomospira nematocera]WDI33565.1 6-bladed beta-propeller [Entomospira nematocera]